MKLRMITPLPQLAPLIQRMWVFESACGLPTDDGRVIVPNESNLKILIPYNNDYHASFDGGDYVCGEGRIHCTGPWDRPVVVGSAQRATGTIGIEFSIRGAYRFCRLDLHEIKNTFVSFEDLFGPASSAIEERIAETKEVGQKIELMQRFLVRQLYVHERQSPLLEYAVEALMGAQGLLPIHELERKTGYTRRYLDRLFQSMVGLPPKRLAAVLRFHRFYSVWAQTGALDFYRDELHDYYYDQAHFIREFRRFSGMAPRSFASRGNEFGRIFHSLDEREQAKET